MLLLRHFVEEETVYLRAQPERGDFRAIMNAIAHLLPAARDAGRAE